jgi:hypothetical protein
MTSDNRGNSSTIKLQRPEGRETWRQELRRLERVVNHLKKLSPASIHYLRDLLNEPGGRFDV